MWLLGAGASAAAGIPTAWDMIWEFKQQLYVSQRRVSPKQVADLANPAVRRELQSFIDGIGSLPEGMTGVDAYPRILAALMEAGWTEADIRKIAGENLLRVMRAVEAVAASKAGERPSMARPES